MPETAKEFLQQQIARGHGGISEVTQAISQVDSARATAWKPEDEDKVKSMIQEHCSFRENQQFVWIRYRFRSAKYSQKDFMSRMAPKCLRVGPEFFLTSKYIFRMFEKEIGFKVFGD